MKKEPVKYPVIEIPADGKSGMWGGAYTTAFLYSPKGNFVIKGYMREVEEYIKKNYTKYFVNFCLWNEGSHRDIWQFYKKDVMFHSPDPKSSYRRRSNTHNKWIVKRTKYPYREGEMPDDNKLEMVFKRLPKRWIPDFDKF